MNRPDGEEAVLQWQGAEVQGHQGEAGSEHHPVIEDEDGRNDDDDGNPNGGDEEDSVTISPILGMDDTCRMKLTPEELEWAREVKDIIEGYPDLDDLSDYFYAQLALITKGNMEEVLERAHGLQEFRQEYKVLDSYEEGCRYLQFMVREFPLQMMSWSFSEEDGTYVLAQDAKHLDTTVLTSPDKVNDWMKASFYLHTAMTPDLATIRRGHIVVIECSGVDWTKKQDYKLLQKMSSQLVCTYPFRAELRHYHTGMIVNMLTSMLKRVLNKELKDSFTMGLQHDCRLDQIYMVPDVATANDRMILRLQESLRRRYRHERTFKLADC